MGDIMFLGGPYKSLDAMLKAKGFEEIITSPDSEPVDKLSEELYNSINEKRPYVDLILLDTDLVREGENYAITEEKSHTLYGKK